MAPFQLCQCTLRVQHVGPMPLLQQQAAGPPHNAHLQLCCLLCRCSKFNLVQYKRCQAGIRAHMLEPISNFPPQCSQDGPCSGRPPAPGRSPVGAPAQIQVESSKQKTWGAISAGFRRRLQQDLAVSSSLNKDIYSKMKPGSSSLKANAQPLEQSTCAA